MAIDTEHSADGQSQIELVVGVLQVEREPWTRIYKEGQLVTWMAAPPPEVEVINLFGKSPGSLVAGLDELHESIRFSVNGGPLLGRLDYYLGLLAKRVKKPEYQVVGEGGHKRLDVRILESVFTLPIKELALFQYFLEETDAPYLYMTNSSSYVVLPRLLELTRSLPPTRVYGGWMMGKRTPFASGANRILSRDVVHILIKNIHNWDYKFVDDLAMGLMLRREKLFHPAVPTVAFSSLAEVDRAAPGVLDRAVHVRLKSFSPDGRNDWLLMRKIHQLVNRGVPSDDVC